MRVVEISGGVGGARLARGLAQVEGIDLTVVVNVGDDERIHGLHVSPDLDTVVYTLAGVEGPQGWGRAGDTFITNDELGRLGLDNTFQLGDLDLAMNIARTEALRRGMTLSKFTSDVTGRMGIVPTVIPATNDHLRTLIENDEGETISFQEYFVFRQHADTVRAVSFDGDADPAPGVLESIRRADVVMIAPSNPPLSIWPILIVRGVRDALSQHPRVVAVSPLFRGRALKGPADRVMASLGLPPGNAGVLAAYDGLLDELIVDTGDAADAAEIETSDVRLRILPTSLTDPDAARIFSEAALG